MDVFETKFSILHRWCNQMNRCESQEKRLFVRILFLSRYQQNWEGLGGLKGVSSFGRFQQNWKSCSFTVLADFNKTGRV